MSSRLDVEAYNRDGFGVVRTAISPSLVSRLRDVVERIQGSVSDLPPALRERLTLERDLSSDKRGGIPASEVGDAIFIIGDAVTFDEAFREVLLQRQLIQAMQDALGAHQIVAHFINVTMKNRQFGRAIAWHRDFPNQYASPSTSDFVRMMICLDGMSDAGGATTFIPGSHQIDDATALETRLPKGWQPLDSHIAKVCCNAGDAVIIHPKVLHGGGPNTTDAPRRNIVLQCGNAFAPLRNIPAAEAVCGFPLDV